MAFVAALGLACQQGRDEEDGGRQAERGAYAAVHEGADLLDLALVPEEVSLVYDEQYLLPPVADELEVTALALGQGPLGRGDEQYQVAPRHEAPGKLLVVADDRVRPRRVDDGDLAQELVGVTPLQNPVPPSLLDRLVGVAQAR